ncbi:MAG: hypothetical protein M0024_14785 [Nitrospiraceae bacterium]|nr:hypothetical protein [Nitrospiraceae bacterium]
MKPFLLIAAIVILGVSLLPPPAHAELNLDKEVLVIPDTHDIKPYVWNVSRSPKGILLELGPCSHCKDTFILNIRGIHQVKQEDLHVFVTDYRLSTFAHIRPSVTDQGYSFQYSPPADGVYRFEVVFRTATGWVDLRKDLKLAKSGNLSRDAGDYGYEATVTPYPKMVYADHVGTFVYHLEYKGSPLNDLERADGSDIQVAGWDENLDDFVYMTPKQNLGGPDIGVSIVFTRAGKHRVFGEFRHRGAVHHIDSDINILQEPLQVRPPFPDTPSEG